MPAKPIGIRSSCINISVIARMTMRARGGTTLELVQVGEMEQPSDAKESVGTVLGLGESRGKDGVVSTGRDRVLGEASGHRATTRHD
jgi:hypothetical protein